MGDPCGTYIDATFGRGGHTQALLARLESAGRVVAFDRDPEAAAAAAQIQDPRFQFVRRPFSQMSAVLAELALDSVDGILADLGVSSPQLDQAVRGFSFMRDGPLDMRMDPSRGESAADLVNRLPEPELRQLLREGGEDRDPGRIARAIVRARPLRTTEDLAQAVIRATKPPRPGAKHPATRTFLAIRRAVNREGEMLDRALVAVPHVLKPGARLAVLTYQSLEDRVVKNWIRDHAEEEKRQPGMAFGQPNAERWVQSLGEVVPSEAEIETNPRARSARLRGAERIGEGTK